MRLRVTRRAATQIEKALDYIEAELPQGACVNGFGTFFSCWRSTLTRVKRPTFAGVRRLSVSPYPYLNLLPRHR